MQSKNTPLGLHVACIMDGNGRWATRCGRPRSAGHRAGVETVHTLVEAAPALGVGTLTLYAFSSDNWKRPPDEVSTLMRLLRRFLDAEADKLAASGVALRAIGRRDRLPADVRTAIERAEARTARGNRLLVRIAIDYSARDALLRAACRFRNEHAVPSRAQFARLLDDGPVTDVDVLVRTGGEQRLSDFLLWEAAYAELFFVPQPWPDFTAADLADVLERFRARDRRFGGLTNIAKTA